MTIKDAKSIGRGLGYSINKNDAGEYRVAPFGLSPAMAEDQACYETDLTSAVDTMRAMAHRANAMTVSIEAN